MNRALTAALAALLLVPAVADAHRPSKRAAANESRYAAENAAREKEGYSGRPRVILNKPKGKHRRKTEVIVPMDGFSLVYCMDVTHSYRVVGLHDCGWGVVLPARAAGHKDNGEVAQREKIPGRSTRYMSGDGCRGYGGVKDLIFTTSSGRHVTKGIFVVESESGGHKVTNTRKRFVIGHVVCNQH